MHYSFFKNARNNYKKLENIPYYLPILIISGTSDPVSGKNGVVKLFFKTYLNARHELLNEINKDEVYEDIGQFILNNKPTNFAILNV